MDIAFSQGIDSNELFFLKDFYIKYFDSIGLLYGYNPESCITAGPIKEHTQPLQILFFNREGKLVSFLNNCYAGGFPNLKWNRDHNLDTVPAKSTVPPDSLLTLHQLVDLISDLNGNAVDPRSLADNDYTVAVFWMTGFGRQSKRLIRMVNEKYNSGNVLTGRVLFINDDGLFH